jgi:curli biogenesis system outer membrane secretion channel CsgG
MGRRFWLFTTALVGWLGLAGLYGCSHSGESASSDTLTQGVGVYPPGPSGVYQPRIGVPPFAVQAGEGFHGSNEAALNDLAADQMTTLVDQTDRFRVIERAQLQQLLKEQSLEGIVQPGAMARQGQVRGVDYLLLGKVTNLRVKEEATGNTFNFGDIGGQVGGAAVSNSSTKITTECGVDIRFVDPTTGEIMASNFAEYNRTDSASSMGLALLGASANSNAEIELSDDDKGRILRLALDEALRKSLPKIDKWLLNQPPRPVVAPATQPTP